MNIKDTGTFLGTSQGWPSVFVVEDNICRLCSSPLGVAKLHPGARGGSVIYSNLNPFKEVIVYVKGCRASTCKAMHRVFPTEEGELCRLLSLPLAKEAIMVGFKSEMM